MMLVYDGGASGAVGEAAVSADDKGWLRETGGIVLGASCGVTMVSDARTTCIQLSSWLKVRHD